MFKRIMKYILILSVFIFIMMFLTDEKNIDIEVSEQEKEEIESFYAIDPESIYIGKSFDLKYSYLDPFALDSDDPIVIKDAVAIDVVLKNKKPIKLGNIAIYNKKDFKILDIDLSALEDKIVTIQDNPNDMFVPLQDDFQRLGNLEDPIVMIWAQSNHYKRRYNLNELRIILDEKDSKYQIFYDKETYQIAYDEDHRLEATRSIKSKCLSGKKCNLYEKRQVKYYFGILFRRDFEQWYQEIKEFISTVDEIQDYDLTISFNNPCMRGKEIDLQEKLGLNDMQFKKCLEIMDLLQYECELRAY